MAEKKAILSLVVMAVMMIVAQSAMALSLQVSWSANTDSDLAGYKLSFGTASGVYTSTTDMGNATSAVISNAAAGTTYYVAVKAYDTTGNLSPYSSEVSVATPAPDTTPPTGTIKINSGAASTGSRVVTLTLSATDNAGTVTGMQFSNDNATWSTECAYATSQAWTLSAGDGAKTVYVKFKDNSGNWSQAYAASIAFAQDTTGCGIPDAWLSSYGLDYTSASIASTDSDGDGYTNLEEYINGTNPTNKYDNAPTVNAGSSQQSNPTRITLSGSATDPHGKTLGYAWTQVLGTTVTIDNATSTSASFLGVKAGLYRFMLTATNDRASSTATVDVTINNVAPTVSAGNNVTVDAGQTVTLHAAGQDANNDTLGYTWSLVSGPQLSLPVLSTQDITFAPSAAGNYTFRVSCTDGVNNGITSDVIVTANAVNHAPTAEAGPDQDVQYGSTVTLDASGSTDPDGDALGYAWTQTSGPQATLSSATAAKPTFTANATGTLVFSLVVGDGKIASTADTVTIRVVKANNAPVAEAGNDATTTVGSLVTLDAGASADPDGDALTYTWTQTSGATATLSATTGSRVTFTPTTAGVLVFKVTVSDGQASADDTVQVTVNSVNHVPVAEAGNGVAATVGQTVTLDGSGSTDADGDTLSYYWSQVGGTTVSLTNPNSVKATFVPTASGTYTFSLTVSDGKATSPADTVAVSVQDGVVTIQALSPANGVAVSSVPTFSWNAPGLTTYTLYIAQNAGTFTKLYSGSATSYKMPSSLWCWFVAPKTTVYWYVVGEGNGRTVKSAVFKFSRK